MLVLVLGAGLGVGLDVGLDVGLEVELDGELVPGVGLDVFLHDLHGLTGVLLAGGVEGCAGAVGQRVPALGVVGALEVLEHDAGDEQPVELGAEPESEPEREPERESEAEPESEPAGDAEPEAQGDDVR